MITLFWSFFALTIVLVALGVPRQVPWFLGSAFVLLALTGAIG